MLSGLNLPTSNRCSLVLGPNTSIPTVHLMSSANLATSVDIRPCLLEEKRADASQSRETLSSRLLLHDAPSSHTATKSCLEKADENTINAQENPQTFTSHSRQNPSPSQSRPNSLTILTPSTPDYPNSRVGNGDSNDGRQLFYLVPASEVNSGSSILHGVSNNRFHQTGSTSYPKPQAAVPTKPSTLQTTPPSITCKIGEKLYRCVEIGKQPTANITKADGCSSVQISEVIPSRRPLQQESVLTSSATSQPRSTGQAVVCDSVQSSCGGPHAQPGLGPTNMSVPTAVNKPATSPKTPQDVEDDQPKKTTPTRQSLSEGSTVAVPESGGGAASPAVDRTFTELTNYKPRSPETLHPMGSAAEKPRTIVDEDDPTLQTHHAVPSVQINENNSSLPRNASHQSILTERAMAGVGVLGQQAPSSVASKPIPSSLDGKDDVDPTAAAGSHCQHEDTLSSRGGRKRRNADRVRRPMNAFMVWARVNRPLLAKNFRGNNNADISIRLGQAWNALTHDQKDPFYREAEELKKQHRKEHPGWVYSPRPPKQKNTGFRLVPSGDHANSLPNCKLNPNSTSYFTFSSNPRYVISQHGPVGIQRPLTHCDNAAGAQLQRPGTSGANATSQYAPPQAQQYVIEPVGPPRRPDSAQIIRHAAAAGQTAVGQTAIQPVKILLNNPSSQVVQQNKIVYQANGGAVLHLVNEGRAQTAVNLTSNHNTVNMLKGVQVTHVADLGYRAPPQAESVQATFGSSTGEERKNGNSSSPRSDSTASARHPGRCDVDLDDDERSLNLHIPDGDVDAAGSERRTVVAPDVQLFQRFLSDLSGTDQQTRSSEWSGAVQPEKSKENGDEVTDDDDDSIINVVT